MKVINLDYKNIKKFPEEISICLGYFDSLHLGHLKLFNYAKTHSKYALSVLTFSEPLSRYIDSGKNPSVITSNKDKERLLQRFNIDYLFIINIDKEFTQLSKDDFIEKILKPLNVKEIFVGTDYRFGYRALGTNYDLKQHFHVEEIILYEIDDEKVSTQSIKQLIQDGKIEAANRLLGRPYEIIGKVTHGYSRGHTLGFPTANVELSDDYVVPRYGVYKTICYIRGVPHYGLTNVGVHPSVDKLNKPIIEVNILDFNEDIYDEVIYIQFIKFIRDEMTFSSLEELKAQIEKDKERIKEK